MLIKKASLSASVMLLIIVGLLSSCRKEYYEDSGLQVGIYPVSSLQVLEQDPFLFDTVTEVIHLAGMDSVLEDSIITFFAPTDHSVAKAMNELNSDRYAKFEDSLKIQDIPKEVWRKFLSHYIFRGKYMLKDISRRDPSQLNVYPGMNMESWDGYIMNLGIVYSNYSGTQDVGPRRVTLTDIGDLADPVNITSGVATADMQTKNGIIHVISDNHSFGFSVFNFANVVREYIQ